MTTLNYFRVNKELVRLGEKIHDALIEFQISIASVEWDWDDDLEGACAVASAFLMKEAKIRLGLQVEFVCTGAHAWNQYNGIIYDLTAKQYGADEKVFTVPLAHITTVHISRHREAYQEEYREGLIQVNNDWCPNQRPNRYQLRWINNNKARIIYKRIS